MLFRLDFNEYYKERQIKEEELKKRAEAANMGRAYRDEDDDYMEEYGDEYGDEDDDEEEDDDEDDDDDEEDDDLRDDEEDENGDDGAYSHVNQSYGNNSYQ